MRTVGARDVGDVTRSSANSVATVVLAVVWGGAMLEHEGTLNC